MNYGRMDDLLKFAKRMIPHPEEDVNKNIRI